MSDPFGEDHNPFADVEDYNPFMGNSRVVVNETPQTSVPSYSPPVRNNIQDSPSSYFVEPSIRLEDSDDDGAPSYFDMKEDNPYKFDDKPQVSSSSRGVVSVQASEANPDADYSMWQMEFYQQFFRIDTEEVVWRCLRSMWPFKIDFINFVSTNPDFYGPLWITTTLIFMFAAAANFSDFLAEPSGWKYDFLKLTVGTGIIYGFAFGIPFLFWLYFKWVDMNISLIELLCIYGYSLFIYCPIAIVCIAPFPAVQWTATSIGALLSTLFLIVNMWNPMKSKLAHAIPLLILMALLHAAIGLTFMLYYFQFNGRTPSPTPGPTPSPTPSPAPMPSPAPPSF